MGLLLVTAVVLFIVFTTVWKNQRAPQGSFPWITILACGLTLLFVRLGFKWAPLALAAYGAWSWWSRTVSRSERSNTERRVWSPRPRTPRMSREDARRVLGVTEDATPQQILAEYRRLMKRVHPDAGGSEDLAARVNEAKTVLLGE